MWTRHKHYFIFRWIISGSNEGDTILDPFVGGGTGNVKQRAISGLIDYAPRLFITVAFAPIHDKGINREESAKR